MVGRFVEEQNVRITEQSFGKEDFDFLAAVQIAHVGIVKVGFDAEAV